MGVAHVTSSPHMPSSNGRAEIAVAQAKHILKRTQRDSKNFELYVALYNSTPLATSAFSPFQLKNNRPFRFNIFFSPEFFKTQIDPHQDLQQRREIRQKAFEAANKSRREVVKFSPGTVVLVQSPLTGLFQEKGTICHPRGLASGSYDILMEDGRVIRRNIHFLREFIDRPPMDQSATVTPIQPTRQATPPPPYSPPRRSLRLAGRPAP